MCSSAKLCAIDKTLQQFQGKENSFVKHSSFSKNSKYFTEPKYIILHLENQYNNKLQSDEYR